MRVFLLLIWFSFVVSPVFADPVFAEGGGVLPDVVELTDGSSVRGTLVERRPDGLIVLQDFQGEFRAFSRDDVQYAGPFERSPSAPVDTPRGSGVASPGTVLLQVTSDHPRLRLQRQLSTGRSTVRTGLLDAALVDTVVHQDVCEGSCLNRVPEGTHRFRAMAGAAAWPIWSTAPSQLTLMEDTEIVVQTRRRGTLRLVTFLSGVALAAGGGALWSISEYDTYDRETGSYRPMDAAFLGGTALISLGAFAMIGSAFIPNQARLASQPLVE